MSDSIEFNVSLNEPVNFNLEVGNQGPKGDKGDTGDRGEKGDPGTTDYNQLQNKPQLDLYLKKSDADTTTAGLLNKINQNTDSINESKNNLRNYALISDVNNSVSDSKTEISEKISQAETRLNNTISQAKTELNGKITEANNKTSSLDGRNININNSPLYYGGNKLSVIDNLEMGNITNNGNTLNVYSNSSTRVRTPENNPIELTSNKITIINLNPSVYKMFIWLINDDKNWSLSDGWVSEPEYTSIVDDDHKKLVLLFGKKDNTNVSLEEIKHNFRILTGTKRFVDDTVSKGNLKSILDFTGGAIKGNGQKVINKTSITTSDIIKLPYAIYIDKTENTNVHVIVYDETGQIYRFITGGATPTKGHYIPAGTNFRLTCVYANNPAVIPNSSFNIKNGYLYNSLKIYKLSEYKELEFNKLISNGYVVDPDNLFNNINLNIGDAWVNGVNYNILDLSRLITTDIIKFDFDVIIPKNTIQYYLWTYDDFLGTNAMGRGWYKTEEGDKIIEAGTYFRMVICLLNTDKTPLLNLYDNRVFKKLQMFKKESNTSNSVFKHNNNYLSVAHQGYSTTNQTYGNSRISSYIGAKKHGFDTGECDIKFTKDNVPVCSHDPKFYDSITNSDIVISEKTFSELKQYNYFGEQIASFEEVLYTCKQIGLGLYIDHLSSNFTDENWNSIFRIIKKYQMQDNVYFLCGLSRNVTNKVLEFYKKAKIVLVVSSADLTPAIKFAKEIKTEYNVVSIDFNYNLVPVEQLQTYLEEAPVNIKFEIWTVDNLETYKKYLPFVSAITSNKICYSDI